MYTAGAVCELTHWPVIIPGWVQAHEVLHFCDTAGSVAFFLFVVRYVVPYEHPANAPPVAGTPPALHVLPSPAAGLGSHF